MTRTEIEAKLAEIRECAQNGEDEGAHSREDRLRQAFLEYLASQDTEIAILAKLVLSTDNLDFARWCA